MTFRTPKEKKATVATVSSESTCPPWISWCCYRFLWVLLNPLFVGVFQIMTGMFNIGLGPGRTSTHPDDVVYLGAPYWLGGVYLVTGITTVTVVCGYWYCRTLSVIMNIISCICATVGIVLYAWDLSDTSFLQMCVSEYDALNTQDNCSYVASIAQRLLTGMDVTLVVVAILQLSLSISFVVRSLSQSLCSRKEKGGIADAEVYQPVLQEVLMTSPGA
ncbi:uncharacterized protein LOC125015841 [Mugil cephalus]|uniref:uncharacterized protein LOC125015841 n=1 Tax=Mugil cephalus TaxID=48193 RepID=UPI001FB578AD|nr:uncharacterized protein LOC125015841 [Mugil cephalus]